MSTARKGYPSDMSDEEWAFVAPYLSLQSEEALQRKYDLREVFNALRWLVRTGAQWRMLPHDFPVGKRSTSRLSAGCGRIALKPWPMTCACSCAWQQVATVNHRQ